MHDFITFGAFKSFDKKEDFQKDKEMFFKKKKFGMLFNK